MTLRWWFYPVILLFSLVLVALGIATLTVVLLYPNLPSIEAVTDYRPKLPLRVYTLEGDVIGEFGEEKRAFVRVQDFPKVMKDAVISAEDERFYDHPGVDVIGLARAATAAVIAGKSKGGASTITQQVARNFFLSNEVTLTRKVSEWLLAFKMERSMTKDQILEVYLNHIFLGNRAFGFAAASRVYYGKDLSELTAGEAAMLAGIPKAPSQYNPFNNLKRATLRQHYVLRRMNELHKLDDAAMKRAKEEPLKFNRERQMYSVNAEHVAEMARQEVFEQYGEKAYVSGIRIYTTIRKADQEAANASLRRGVMDYDHRHGYRGPEGFIKLGTTKEDDEETADEALQEKDVVGDLIPAIVLEAEANHRPHQAGRNGQTDRRGAEVCCAGIERKIVTAKTGAWLNHPAWAGRKRHMGGDAIAKSRGRSRLGRAQRRRNSCTRGGIRFHRQQVQSRDAGMAPTRIQFQAVHLFCRARKRFHARHYRQRCAGGIRPGPKRRPDLGAEELRRQI